MLDIDHEIISPDDDITVKNPRILIFVNYECRLLGNSDEVTLAKKSLESELNKLKFFFESRHYHVEDKYIYQNLHKSDESAVDDSFEDILRQCSEDEDLQQHDSLVICILGIAGEDGLLCLADDKITMDEIIKPFKGNKCQFLKEKPKLFLVQLFSGIKEVYKSQSVHEKRLPIDADLFVAYAKLPYNWKGSTMVSNLDQASSGSPNPELCDIFVSVNREINESVSDFEDQSPSLFSTSSLTKFVYFGSP